MHRKKTLLLISGTTMVLSVAFLTKLAMDLTHNKKKIEDLYLELAFVLSVLMLSFITTIFLIKEKKHEKLERFDSILGLPKESSNEEEKEEVEEQPKKLERSASPPALFNFATVPVQEIKSELGKEDEEIDIYNLTGQSKKIEVFGKDDTILAITLPKSYSITMIDGGEKIPITDKKDIINHGDKYKPIDFQVSKDGIFTFKYQHTKKDNVFIELTCDTLNVYSGWKDNDEKSVTNYFKDLNTKAKEAAKEIEAKKIAIKKLEAVKKSGASIEKLQQEIKELEAIAVEANDDFLIFLDVKKIFFKPLRKILKFMQWFASANSQGLSFVEGESIYKKFQLSLVQEENSIHVKGKFCFYLPFLSFLDTTFPIIDILVNNRLVHKEVEVVKEVEDNTHQVPPVQIVSTSNEAITTTSDGLEVEHTENQKKIEQGVQEIAGNLVEKAVQEGISESNSSHTTVTTAEAMTDNTSKPKNEPTTTDIVDASPNSPTKKSDQKQDEKPSCSMSRSQSLVGSKESINSALTSKKSKSPLKKVKNLGNVAGQQVKEKWNKITSKFSKKDGTKSEGASPSPSIDEIGTEPITGADNQGFMLE